MRDNDRVIKLWQIWTEGYELAPGPQVRHSLLAEINAETFDEACALLALDPEHSKWMKKQSFDGQWLYWGCRLWDNALDASKRFG